MWLLYGLMVHLALLGSIFVIHFRSPVITGLRAQESLAEQHLQAPAKRLVLFVADGLRAESFFRHNCSDIPQLHDLMLRQGLVGISHTRMPTESRPGHIALAAGFYEDPSAVLRGWKENPVEFDSVFNRSTRSYGWGHTSILSIFSRKINEPYADGDKMIFNGYGDDMDFSGRNNTSHIDEWVLRRVNEFLHRNATEIKTESQVIFFLHLCGTDIAGHIYKPGTERFVENLQRTVGMIRKTYETFERTFPDRQTAYILTSDHGMTDSGSHGCGEAVETETPLFVWGVGVKRRANNVTRSCAVGSGHTLPLHEIEQTQIAPLISALVGMATPMNNLAKVPLQLLNISAEYGAHAAHSNALQLLEQFSHLLRDQNRGILTKYLRKFERLDGDRIVAYKQRVENLIASGAYDASTNVSYDMMDRALDGINYYFNYYRNVLLLSTVLTFIGWMYYLMQLLLETVSKETAKWQMPVALCVAVVAVVILCVLQSVPWAVTFYLTLPFAVWMGPIGKGLIFNAMPNVVISWKKLLAIVVYVELLVLTFFEVKFISLCFLLFVSTYNWPAIAKNKCKALPLIILLGAISVFPLLPLRVGHKNFTVLLASMSLVLARPFIKKWPLSYWRVVIGGACLANVALCIYQNTNYKPVSIISHTISWCFMVYSVASVLLCDASDLAQRLDLIFFNLTVLYAFFCTSYELLFVFMLSSELLMDLTEESTTDDNPDAEERSVDIAKDEIATSFHFAFRILLYSLLSLFGTGNIASLSSFDVNVIRCFLTKFSHIIILALIIVKLLLPMLLNITIILSTSAFVRSHQKEIGICMFLICDTMGLQFFFFVRNTGSWKDIGSSISHFVILEMMTLLLILLIYFAKLLLKLKS